MSKEKGGIAIARVGQLCGDTESGAWNESEAWPLMLSASGAMGALPRLDAEGVGWLAVDTAAAAVVEIARAELGEGTDGTDATDATAATVSKELAEIPTFHILNPDRTRTWNDDLLLWMQKLVPELSIIPAREWVQKLESVERHLARKLLGLWRGLYCAESDEEGADDREGVAEEDPSSKEGADGGENASSKEGVVKKEGVDGGVGKKGGGVKGPIFSIERTKDVTPSMRAVKPVTEEHFAKMWAWIERNVGVHEGE